MSAPELHPTADGSLSAYSRRFGQDYGSRFGAATQARQVFVEGSGTPGHPAPRVLEVGFGLGQNFRETLKATHSRPLHYLAYELDPVSAEVLRAVSAPDPASALPGWSALLETWPASVVRPGLTLDLRLCDVTKADLPRRWAMAVYLDGFSPAVNPELWEAGFLARLAGALQPGGVLVTYCSAGFVRRGLQAAGLQVERLRGPAGKREVLRATKVGS